MSIEEKWKESEGRNKVLEEKLKKTQVENERLSL